MSLKLRIWFHVVYYFLIIISDKPVFVSQNDITQYGRLGHPINIKVYVYSFPEIASIQVMIHGMDSFDNNRYVNIKNITTKDIIFEKEVYLTGYVITIEGYDLTRTDFTFYKLNVTNKIGYTEFKVVLKEAGNGLACSLFFTWINLVFKHLYMMFRNDISHAIYKLYMSSTWQTKQEN